MLHGAKYMGITQSNRDLEFTSLLNMMRDGIIASTEYHPGTLEYTSGGWAMKCNTAVKV